MVRTPNQIHGRANASEASWRTVSRDSPSARRKATAWRTAEQCARASPATPRAPRVLPFEPRLLEDVPGTESRATKFVKSPYLTRADANTVLKARKEALNNTNALAIRKFVCPFDDCGWLCVGNRKQVRSKRESHMQSWHSNRPIARRAPLEDLDRKVAGKQFQWACPHCKLGQYDQANTRVAGRARVKHHHQVHPVMPASDFTLHAKGKDKFKSIRRMPAESYQRNRDSLAASALQKRMVALKSKGHHIVAAACPTSPGVKWQSCNGCHLSAAAACSSWQLACVPTSFRRPTFARRGLGDWDAFFKRNERQPTQLELIHKATLEDAIAFKGQTHSWKTTIGSLQVCTTCGVLRRCEGRSGGFTLQYPMACGITAFPNVTFGRQLPERMKVIEATLRLKRITPTTRRILIAARGKWMREKKRREGVGNGTKRKLTAANLMLAPESEAVRRRRF